jgi:hypothetical protein
MDGNTAVTTIAADLAASRGVLVVNAAGNERNKPWHHIIAPADGDSVIAVGAVDAEGNISVFSSAGPTYDGRIKPDVMTMGVDTYCATIDGYGNLGGTSFATPLAAGVCALLLEAHPGWTPVQVRDSLHAAADRADQPDTLYGWGIVNAAKASGLDYLVVSPEELSFETFFGDTESQQSLLEIANWRGGDLEWEAATTADWISVVPPSYPEPTTAWVRVNPSNLRAGANVDTITISAGSAINLFQKIPVYLTLHPGGRVLTFPNPFTDSLTVIVEEEDPLSQVKVSVFTTAGELVYRFPEREANGIYQQSWDGRNENGEEVAGGVYLLHVDVGGRSEIYKVARVK